MNWPQFSGAPGPSRSEGAREATIHEPGGAVGERADASWDNDLDVAPARNDGSGLPGPKPPRDPSRDLAYDEARSVNGKYLLFLLPDMRIGFIASGLLEQKGVFGLLGVSGRVTQGRGASGAGRGPKQVRSPRAPD